MILILSIVPFIIISFYSRPCVDDYNFSLDMIRMVEKGNVNIFKVLKAAFKTDMDFYKGWNGLYSSGFLQAMQPGAYLGEHNYYVGTFFLMLMMFGGSYYFISTLSLIFDLKLKPFLPALFMFAFFIHGMINTVQGLYWFCGAIDYITFFFLTMVNISLILRYFHSENKAYIYIILAVIASFVNSGGNHITGFLNILILLVLSIYSLLKKKKYGVFIVLITAIAGFLLVVFAPGTRVRMNEFETRTVYETVVATVYRTFDLVLGQDYTFNPRFIAYIILLTFFAATIKDTETIKKLKIDPVLLFLIFAMFYCAMLAVPYYAMGSFGAGRIKNIIWMCYVVLIGLLWIYTLIFLACRLNFVNHLLDLTKKIDIRIVCICASLIIVIFSRNMYSVITELSDGTAATFAAQYEERYELMRINRGSDKIVEVEPLIESKNLFFGDLTDDVTHWINASWSEYYKVQTVIKTAK